MPLKKTILFPFQINSSYFEGYAWAMELAFRMKARLQLLTTTSESFGSTVPSDSIYHSLLQANGYYLEHYKRPEGNLNKVNRQPSITTGDLKDDLIHHLKQNPVDILVIDSQFLRSQFRNLQEIEKEAKSMIILPEMAAATKQQPDHFYDVLRESELYKLPENFFTTLGNDSSMFNYLRKIFQKK